MENRPHIIISGLSVPPDIEDRYFEWFDEVYDPAYVKMDTSTITATRLLRSRLNILVTRLFATARTRRRLRKSGTIVPALIFKKPPTLLPIQLNISGMMSMS